MSGSSLYQRMRAEGTLSEEARDIPDAGFALASTLNWMRAEAILVQNQGVTFDAARTFYSRVQKRILTGPQLNSVSEQLLFSLHQIAALKAMDAVPNKADVARVGIVTWYYSVYGAASAMLAAADGSSAETHAATANQWERQFAVGGLVMPPFGDRLSSLVSEDIETQMRAVRARGVYPLRETPQTPQQAWGCHAEYLQGTSKWERWNVEQRVKSTPAFKALGTDSFRTRDARALRDAAFGNRSIAFLHQAARYRGKANYRDAIYLAYGRGVEALASGFIADLSVVAEAFLAMATGYCSMRMGRELWTEFVADLEDKRSISLSPAALWTPRRADEAASTSLW